LGFNITKKEAKENAILNLLSRINSARINIIERNYNFQCRLRGKNAKDTMHWAVSRIFDVFWYAEAIKGNILKSKWDLFRKAHLKSSEAKVLAELFKIREKFKFDKKLLDKVTNITESKLNTVILELMHND